VTAPTIEQIAEGLQARLATIDGLRAFDTVPGQFSPPAALVDWVATTFDAAMARGLDEHEFRVDLYVARRADDQSQQRARSYANPAGATSVKAAVGADRTLGGVVSDCRVERAEPVTFEIPASPDPVLYLGVQFTVRVWARGA
jgi:hypothetical protein